MRTASDSKMTTGSIPFDSSDTMPPVSPGRMIKEFWLSDTGETPAQLADRLGWSLAKTKRLLSGELIVDREVALCLKQVFGNSMKFWLGVEHDWAKHRRQAKGQATGR